MATKTAPRARGFHASLARMPRFSRVVVILYLLFNVAIAYSLYFAPQQLDAQYKGTPPITPTREFLWASSGNLHLFLIAATAAVLWMKNASERRYLLFANAGVYFLDAATQWLYWGTHVGLEPKDLHVNAGVSAVTGALVLAAALADRPRS
jgi:hypothetical protein